MDTLSARPRREHRAPAWLAASVVGLADEDAADGCIPAPATSAPDAGALIGRYGGFRLVSRVSRELAGLEPVGDFPCRESLQTVCSKPEAFAGPQTVLSRLEAHPPPWLALHAVPPLRLLPAAGAAKRPASEHSQLSSCSDDTTEDSARPAKRFRQYCPHNPYAAQAAAASLLAGAAWIDALQALAAAKTHAAASLVAAPKKCLLNGLDSQL